eukprot:m.63662 g.63662  ORF g.63662 m.63662 type:complete len:413 (+) comp13974_c0_seq6:1206-2444(+)
MNNLPFAATSQLTAPDGQPSWCSLCNLQDCRCLVEDEMAVQPTHCDACTSVPSSCHLYLDPNRNEPNDSNTLMSSQAPPLPRLQSSAVFTASTAMPMLHQPMELLATDRPTPTTHMEPSFPLSWPSTTLLQDSDTLMSSQVTPLSPVLHSLAASTAMPSSKMPRSALLILTPVASAYPKVYFICDVCLPLICYSMLQDSVDLAPQSGSALRYSTGLHLLPPAPPSVCRQFQTHSNSIGSTNEQQDAHLWAYTGAGTGEPYQRPGLFPPQTAQIPRRDFSIILLQANVCREAKQLIRDQITRILGDCLVKEDYIKLVVEVFLKQRKLESDRVSQRKAWLTKQKEKAEADFNKCSANLDALHREHQAMKSVCRLSAAAKAELSTAVSAMLDRELDAIYVSIQSQEWMMDDEGHE